ncbi:TPA: hypothetical protein SMP28_003289 [Proteus mirabilis]|uniref:hypothetical protein n=1 Tax=Proteus mirabilis TaxID=584 RepID=UPI00236308FF|nr:hypothetical protein [Proteus mirabilis]MDC9743652.1 hypothetical protein [Proteus mirabilis]HEK0415921.1 hypothetical protein [Proteus mirabilis]HEK0610340.1 hypothetical protein [Proteus mirabilis]HEK2812116.1 hypothetical protein [Proteus mirabilis]HEK2830106.1 hypothetical protein [Proteus mirabilis]
MNISSKTSEKLRNLINEETEYRSGPKLVKFFNTLGFNHSYGQGFPSRWKYTDDCLDTINGTPRLDKCIKEIFNPINFISRIEELDRFIAEFNQYLAFDKWRVIRNGAEITFEKLHKVELNDDNLQSSNLSESDFLNREFSGFTISDLGLDINVTEVLNKRIEEIEKTYNSAAYLSTILIAGSTLEGVFLGLASSYPRAFNTVKSSPKGRDGKVQPFHDWNLAAFINVAKDLELIQLDTYKFSHTLRDFRNYIHPYQQMLSGFTPREHTAKICLQVLKAAITEMTSNVKKLRS